MKIYSRIALGLTLLGLGTTSLFGQGNPFMGMGNGPRFDGHMAKLFGSHQNFSCSIDVDATPSDRPDGISMPGKLSYSEGKSRFEMDLTKIKGGMIPAGMMDQIKAMGMAEMSIISRPDSDSSYIVYPGLKSFAPLPATPKAAAPDKYTLESSDLGKEKVEGQDCLKSQVTVSGPDGKKFEATVWNAPNLKDFPVRVRSSEGGVPFTLTFKEVKFEKPAAAHFETPASFTKYEDAATLMRGAIMKKMNEAGGAPTK